MKYIQLTTESGEAYILMEHVVGIVRHEGDEPFNVDLHMKSGTIFVVIDYTEKDFWALLQAWTMFKDNGVLSPAYIEDGRVREL